MTEKKHEINMTIIYYSKANNGGMAYRELDALLLKKGYKIENFQHTLEVIEWLKKGLILKMDMIKANQAR